MDMFSQNDGLPQWEGVVEEVVGNRTSRESLTYEEVVKELLYDEKHHLRDLHMIIKVFREEICRLIPPGQNKAAEFDVYSRHAKEIVSPSWRESLNKLVSIPEVSLALQSAGHGFREAVKYYLPKLVIASASHCFLYFDYIKLLHRLTPLEDDRESLEQVEGLLKPLQVELTSTLGNIKRDAPFKVNGRIRRQIALEKTSELQKTIDGWDQKELGQFCNELIRDDVLMKVSSGRRLTERRVVLFDGVLILCKSNTKRTAVSVTAPLGGCTADSRLKERFFIRKVEIIDREDSEGDY
ncbi:hypothetical protein AAG570_007041 [Ranatra chinensis]|uniref:DH domain-containing protein n=1 Tax=Ranatra chinensis TaxID=642074 RepID=A0ABD0YVS7_9HEMI